MHRDIQGIKSEQLIQINKMKISIKLTLEHDNNLREKPDVFLNDSIPILCCEDNLTTLALLFVCCTFGKTDSTKTYISLKS